MTAPVGELEEAEMTEKRDERQQDDVDEEVLDDLDAGDDAEQVVGGKATCPCEGGELR